MQLRSNIVGIYAATYIIMYAHTESLMTTPLPLLLPPLPEYYTSNIHHIVFIV